MAEFGFSKIRYYGAGFASNRPYELTPDFFQQINIKISCFKADGHRMKMFTARNWILDESHLLSSF